MAMNTPLNLGYAHIGRVDHIDGSAGLPAVPTVTPVESIANTLSEARELSARVQGIVENLVGQRLEIAGSKECRDARPSMGGILPGLSENADDTLSHLRRANEELSRLSKVLGLGL